MREEMLTVPEGTSGLPEMVSPTGAIGALLAEKQSIVHGVTSGTCVEANMVLYRSRWDHKWFHS